MARWNIRVRASACSNLLKRLLQFTGSHIKTSGSQLEIEWIEEQVLRFNMWASNLGVFALGHASIEHRLRDHVEAYSLVVQYLDALNANLVYLTTATTDEATVLEESMTSSTLPVRAHTAMEDDQPRSPFDDSPPLSQVSSKTSSSKSEPNEKTPDQCFVVAKSEVKDILSRLSRLSASIRRSGFSARNAKADSFEDREAQDKDLTAEFAGIVTVIVNHRFPEATENLRKRLVDSVTRRRNRLAYRQKHQQKLAMPDEVRMSTTVTDKKLESQSWLPTAHTQNAPESSFEPLASKGHLSATSATDIEPGYRPSYSSLAPSQGSATVSRVSAGNGILKYPSAPKLGKQDVFECPYCFVLCPAKEAHGNSWKRHIMKDLEPYLCVLPSCSRAQDLYSDFGHWINHMKIQHLASKWECVAHSRRPEVFDSSESYVEHMRSFHTAEFVPSQLSSLSRMNERKTSRVFGNCPLCNAMPIEIAEKYPDHETTEGQDALQYHVAHHLKSLALLSLSWIEVEERSESSHASIGLSYEESSGPLTFEDPPVDRNPTYTDLDVDWKGVPPIAEVQVDDPEWTRKIPNDWSFCRNTSHSPLPLYKEHHLANFVGSWLNRATATGHRFLQLASEHEHHRGSMITQFLDKQNPSAPIMTTLLHTATENESYAIEILNYLADRILTYWLNHPETQNSRAEKISDKMLVFAASDKNDGARLTAILMNLAGPDYWISKEMVEAAHENTVHGEEILNIYLHYNAKSVNEMPNVILLSALQVPSLKDTSPRSKAARPSKTKPLNQWGNDEHRDFYKSNVWSESWNITRLNSPKPSQTPEQTRIGRPGPTKVTAYPMRTPPTTMTVQGPSGMASRFETQDEAFVSMNGYKADRFDPNEYKQIKDRPHKFFVVGRVFSMFYHENAGELSDHRSLGGSNFAMVARGEHSHHQIRSFVVAQAVPKQFFSYCCPITTYGGQATTKKGVDKKAHTMVYSGDTPPQPLAGEEEMTKDPLRIELFRLDGKLDDKSRINLGRVHSIDHNFKVLNIGMVDERSIPKLIAYRQSVANAQLLD